MLLLTLGLKICLKSKIVSAFILNYLFRLFGNPNHNIDSKNRDTANIELARRLNWESTVQVNLGSPVQVLL